MKTLKAVLLVAAAFSMNALAFHSGGVAECNGCHTMHGSLEGKQVTDHNGDEIPLTYLTSGPYLLKGTDQSSACLTCHSGNGVGYASYQVLTHGAATPAYFTPGGDFAWLEKTYIWEVRSGTFETSKGERKGHNVIAADYNLHADATLVKAPGGDFLAANLQCSSCHDPHGKYRRLSDGTIVDGKATSLPIIGSGSYQSSKDPTAWGAVGVYRILGGVGYAPKSYSAIPFTQTVPAAVAPSSYNKKESDTAIVRVAYGQGMSEWCANCHPNIHLTQAYVSGTPGLRHPAGNNEKLDSFIVENYGKYVKTGNLGGDPATSYSTLAPFEEGTADYSILKTHTGNVKTGPVLDQANVSCMSCHRAHATGFDSMLRFPLAADYMTAADATGAPTFGDPAAAPGTDDVKVAMGRTNAEMSAALYGRTPASFAPYQRAYCNKCHVKD